MDSKYALWKLKHDHSYETLCESVAEKLHCLRYLSIDLAIYDDPFDTSDEAEWKWSIYAFRDMHVKHCRIRLRNVMVEDDILRVEEFKLQQAILGEGSSLEKNHKDTVERRAWMELLDGKWARPKQPLRILRLVGNGANLQVDRSKF